MATLLRIFILIVPFWSLAHASKCDNMPEGDNKSLCAALDQKASRFCDFITNQDSRHSCVARVQINSYACDKVKSIQHHGHSRLSNIVIVRPSTAQERLRQVVFPLLRSTSKIHENVNIKTWV
jgi:hypothetical protein